MDGIDADPLLGEAVANYPSDRLRPLLIAGVVVAPVALVLGLTTALVTDWWGPVVTVVLMATTVLVLSWYVLHVWNREIVLYERGFSYREGSKTVFFRYDEIAAIRQRAERRVYFGGLLRRDVYHFTVTTTKAERFSITNLYRRAAELGQRLNEQVDRTLGPQIAQQLAAGGAVAFGDMLTLNAAGLREAGRRLDWTNYGGYRLGGSRLALLDAAGAVWLALPLAEVDNVTLLLELLRQHQPAARL